MRLRRAGSNAQTRGLAHALRGGHYSPTIEQEHRRRFERPDHVEQARCVLGTRVDQALSCRKGNAATAQLGRQVLRDLGRQRRGASAVREVNYRAVFGDNGIDEVQVAGDPSQVIEDPSGDKQYQRCPARGPLRSRPADASMTSW